jgi:hypothetical protein
MNTLGQHALLVDKTNASQRLLNQAQRQSVAAVEVIPATPEVNLSDDSKDPHGSASKVTDKFEQAAADLFELGPLSLPTKADIKLFEKNFTRALDKAGVDTTIEIDLRANSEGKIEVSNDHPDKDKIEAMFANDSKLQQDFVRAEIYQGFQKLHALHQQWQQKVDNGASEEAANLWLMQATKSMLSVNTGMKYQDGKIVNPSNAKQSNDPMQVIANLKANINL